MNPSLDSISGGASAESEPSAAFGSVVSTKCVVTVKFVTQDGSVFTQAYLDTISVGHIKALLVDVFGVPANCMALVHDAESVDDERVLGEFVAGPYNIVEFALVSTDDRYAISAEDAYTDYAVIDVITVRVQTECGCKDVVVEIEDRSVEKPFLGGYVNKESLVEYHHAYSQTGPPPPKVPPELKNHRDTQTCWWRNRKTETSYSRATQMANESTWIPNVNDRLFTSGPYETAEEREKRLDVLGKVLTIQRYYRAWKLRKMINFYSEEYKRRVRKEQEGIARYNRENERSRRQELITKVFPRTKAEFASVYAMIERWKRAEIERISKNHCGPAKISEFYFLLDREVEMLRALENHRIKLQNDMKLRKDLQFFESIGSTVKWNCSYKSLPVEMDTLETQKGREYFAMFKDVGNTNLDKEGRLQALLNVKLTLQHDNCPLATELTNLINRACELITRGITDKHLDALYKRIRSTMVRHFQQPKCNENVTLHWRRVKERNMEGNLFYCLRCQKLRTSDLFPIDSRVKSLKVCSSCLWYDKSAEPWVNLGPYRFMLRVIRREERQKRATSSFAFILQDRDIFYLVNSIWHGRSAVSECSDIYCLHLCRWRPDEDWSPWNCILLTREEAKQHLRVRSLEEVYDEQFISEVNSKHNLARRHFAAVADLNEGCEQEEKPPTPPC